MHYVGINNRIFLTPVKVIIMAAEQSSTCAVVDTLSNTDSEDSFHTHNKGDACSNNASDRDRNSWDERNSGTSDNVCDKLLMPTGHVVHQQFNIQQLYVLPALYLCVLYLSENKQRLVPLTA